MKAFFLVWHGEGGIPRKVWKVVGGSRDLEEGRAGVPMTEAYTDDVGERSEWTVTGRAVAADEGSEEYREIFKGCTGE